MTRPTDGSALRGETHLIEQSARDAFGWGEPEPDDRLSPGKAIAVIGLLCLALWGGIAIAATFAMGWL